MSNGFKSLAIVSVVAGLLVLSGCASKGGATTAKSTNPVKVVYHVNDSADAVNAMRNANNHIDADPTVKITFVTHSKGIDFLIDGAADKDGNPYNINIEKLMARGADFRVCNNTLVKRKIDPKTVIAGATIIPSGVSEVSRLQSEEGYVYIKP